MIGKTLIGLFTAQNLNFEPNPNIAPILPIFPSQPYPSSGLQFAFKQSPAEPNLAQKAWAINIDRGESLQWGHGYE